MADINMVPFIDVLLVLLVIFLVTAPLLNHAVPLQLPQATSTPLPPTPQALNVAINAQGSLFLNGQALSRSQLQARLAEAGQGTSPPPVHLQADQNVPYRHVAQTLADCAAAHLSQVGFVSQPTPP